MELDLPPPRQPPPFSDLGTAIQRAAEAAAALSAPSSSAHAAAAAAALREAHATIGCFLSRLDAPPAASPFDSDQDMADGREEEAEEQMVGEVEEGLRETSLQGSKRRKRPVPPSWPLGRRSAAACVDPEPALDVEGRRRAAMDLLLQFHG